MNLRNIVLSLSFCWLCLFSPGFECRAQTVPPLVNFQGKLVQSNGLPLATGDYELRFRIYDAGTNGNLIWGPQVFDGQFGVGHGPLIPVIQGWCNVMLGPVDTNGVLILSAFVGTNRFVEIQVGSAAPIASRQRILSAPYSANSERLQGRQWQDFFESSEPGAAKVKLAEVAEVSRQLVGLATTNALTLHVAPTGNDSNDGSSVERAKRTIQAAIHSVPLLIRHPVQIAIQPGNYQEDLRISGRPIVEEHPARLKLTGMGANPGEVVITGVDNGGNVVRDVGLRVIGSQVELNNLTLSRFRVLGVQALDRSFVVASQINVTDCGNGFSFDRYTHASMGSINIENNLSTGYAAVWAESFSVSYFNGVLVKRFAEGIKVSNGAIGLGTSTVTFDNVAAPKIEETAGKFF